MALGPSPGPPNSHPIPLKSKSSQLRRRWKAHHRFYQWAPDPKVSCRDPTVTRPKEVFARVDIDEIEYIRWTRYDTYIFCRIHFDAFPIMESLRRLINIIYEASISKAPKSLKGYVSEPFSGRHTKFGSDCIQLLPNGLHLATAFNSTLQYSNTGKGAFDYSHGQLRVCVYISVEKPVDLIYPKLWHIIYKWLPQLPTPSSATQTVP